MQSDLSFVSVIFFFFFQVLELYFVCFCYKDSSTLGWLSLEQPGI